MDLPSLLTAAREIGASDLHLEAGLPPSARVRGQLQSMGAPVGARELLEAARELVGEDRWPDFLERRSADVARSLGGARCRVNVLCTARGVGMAIRFLPAAQATLERLNLRSDLSRLVEPHHGLVIVCGPTGSGKSSTLAALVQELNLRESRHVVTLESPIEYVLTPRLSFIRQREVGRDTPSFEQGLYDAMREDPDVLVVGELRDAETMRLTLSAAETGHLVLTTVHSSSAAEALQRIVGAFPAEIQAGIATQLADCLVGVVCQRLRWFPERNLRAPECEVLVANQAVKAMVRQAQFFKIATALETGAADGCFTFARYREWLERRTDWYVPGPEPVAREGEGREAAGYSEAAVGPSPRRMPDRRTATPPAPATSRTQEGVLEISSSDEDLARILDELERTGK
ncbi:MAG: PilT/PilU family type 4a pilus ATPase [Deltaproteobacteria bacterium]